MSSSWKLGLIGAGNMGTALLAGVVKAGLVAASDVFVTDVDSGRARSLAESVGGRAVDSNTALLEAADTIILAVKPQVIGDVLGEIAPVASARHLFISIAAGIPIGLITGALGDDARVVRVMPNTPSLLGCGAAGLASGGGATPEDMQRALDIFGAVGIAVEVEESQINAVTGLSGSGPAYVFRMVEAMVEAGVSVGLSREAAEQLTLQTVLGAARMVVETDVDPAELRRRVTSPGGTTEAGLAVMEEAGFADIVGRTVARATERGEELGRTMM